VGLNPSSPAPYLSLLVGIAFGRMEYK